MEQEEEGEGGDGKGMISSNCASLWRHQGALENRLFHSFCLAEQGVDSLSPGWNVPEKELGVSSRSQVESCRLPEVICRENKKQKKENQQNPPMSCSVQP